MYSKVHCTSRARWSEAPWTWVGNAMIRTCRLGYVLAHAYMRDARPGQRSGCVGGLVSCAVEIEADDSSSSSLVRGGESGGLERRYPCPVSTAAA